MLNVYFIKKSTFFYKIVEMCVFNEPRKRPNAEQLYSYF